MMLLDGMVEVLVLYAGDPGLDSLRGPKICYLGWITGPRPNSSKHSLLPSKWRSDDSYIKSTLL